MGSSATFPSSNRCAFGKDEHSCMAHLCHTFKVLIHQLCAAAGDRSFTAQDAFDNIEACIEYSNHLQFAHCDEIWLCKTGQDEVFQAFQVFEGLTFMDVCQQCFLNAVQLAGQKKLAQQ